MQPHHAERDRRGRIDRRRRVLWSVLYGSFNPRRRAPPRRRCETRFHALDWHSARLLPVTIGILLFSVADALMTVRLLSDGATEVNPLMAAVIGTSGTAFAAVKMSLTGFGAIVMVMLARYRFMRVLRVELGLYAVLVGYALLLVYEYSLLRPLIDAFDL